MLQQLQTPTPTRLPDRQTLELCFGLKLGDVREGSHSKYLPNEVGCVCVHLPQSKLNGRVVIECGVAMKLLLLLL